MYEGKKFSNLVELSFSLSSRKWHAPHFPDTSLAYILAMAEDILPIHSTSNFRLEDLTFGSNDFSVSIGVESSVDYGKDSVYKISHSAILYSPSNIMNPLRKTLGSRDARKASLNATLTGFYVPDLKFLSDLREWRYRSVGLIDFNIEDTKAAKYSVKVGFHDFTFHNFKGGNIDMLILEREQRGVSKKRTRRLLGPPQIEMQNKPNWPMMLANGLAQMVYSIHGDPSCRLTMTYQGNNVDLTALLKKALGKLPPSEIEKDVTALGDAIKRKMALDILDQVQKLYLIGIDSTSLTPYRDLAVKMGSQSLF